jgi:hypothetical protein
MPTPRPPQQRPEPERRKIFRALVDAQDRELTVPQSRKFVIRSFHLTDRQLRAIEREGLTRQWPPL